MFKKLAKRLAFKNKACAIEQPIFLYSSLVWS